MYPEIDMYYGFGYTMYLALYYVVSTIQIHTGYSTEYSTTYNTKYCSIHH